MDLINQTLVGAFQTPGNGLVNAVQVNSGLVYVVGGSDGLFVLDDNSLKKRLATNLLGLVIM